MADAQGKESQMNEARQGRCERQGGEMRESRPGRCASPGRAVARGKPGQVREARPCN
jgi:hypothetical protein